MNAHSPALLLPQSFTPAVLLAPGLAPIYGNWPSKASLFLDDGFMPETYKAFRKTTFY